jgi:hypothetical protein
MAAFCIATTKYVRTPDFVSLLVTNWAEHRDSADEGTDPRIGTTSGGPLGR